MQHRNEMVVLSEWSGQWLRLHANAATSLVASYTQCSKVPYYKRRTSEDSKPLKKCDIEVIRISWGIAASSLGGHSFRIWNYPPAARNLTLPRKCSAP